MDRQMSIQKISTRQIKAARALLAWSQDELAKSCGVSAPTIRRLEAVDGELGGRAGTRKKICAAFSQAGIQFLDGDAIGVRLRIRKCRKQ
jgi:predicted transcriptional regulator